jgi:hypothetical protein
MRAMKKLVIFIFLLLALPLSAQQTQFTAPQAVLNAPTSNVVMSFSMNATGRGPTIPLAGTGVVWHRVIITKLGTVTGLTFSLDSSDDGNTWSSGGIIASTANAIPPSSNNSVTGVATAFASVNVTALTGGGTVFFRYEGTVSSLDPCSSPLTYKQSQQFNNLSVATKVIANVTGTRTYICYVQASNTGTTPTMLFTSGTGSACGTGTNNMTGVETLISATPWQWIGLGDTGLSHDFCITPGGTSPSASGNVIFVQQ